MTTQSSNTTPLSTENAKLETVNVLPRTAPFLVWPVARREFYYSICLALLPTLTWGAIIFGWRAAAGTIALALGALVTNIVLKRIFKRGKRLLSGHTVGCALMAACLFHPATPAWMMLLAGVTITVILFLWGGPGREFIVAAPVVACAPLLYAMFFADFPPPADLVPLANDRILARDRLLLGDLNDVSPDAIPLSRWESSRQLDGNDAIPMFRPAPVAHRLLDSLSSAIDVALRHEAAGEKMPMPISVDAGQNAAQPQPYIDEKLMKLAALERIGTDELTKLPSLERVGAGTVPGSIGVVSVIAISLGGFYLAYRNILRPKSTFLFIGVFIVGLVLFALTPESMYHIGLVGFAKVWQALPSTLVTLLAYSFFGSDAIFAGVVLLAWPGIEPVTTGGRRTFILLTALTAAVLHRYCPIPIPAATLSILFFHPLAPVFDRASKRRSWLSR